VPLAKVLADIEYTGVRNRRRITSQNLPRLSQKEDSHGREADLQARRRRI
jgi:hypothetical protein